MASIRDILLLSMVAVSLPVCFLRPAYGVVVWTILGFLNPRAFTWGIAREAPLAQAVAIATVAGFLVSAQFKRLFCREVWLLFVLWLWFTLTTLNSADVPMFADKAADAWFRWRFVSKILFMTVVTISVIDTRERLRWLLLAVSGSFGLLVLKMLPGIILSGGRYRVYGPDNSMIADNNAFGLALNMALPFMFFLASTEPDRRLKWFFGLAFVAAIPTIFFTYSRGALVGLIAMSFWMLLRSNRKMLLIPVALLASLFAVFLTPQGWRDRMTRTTPESLDASAQSRLNSWAFSWNLATAHPLMGGGFEAFTPALYARYGPNPRDVHGPHSIYFGVLAEHGFIGFFLYFSLVGYCFVALYRIAKTARFFGDEDSVSCANMLRFSLISFLASGAFLGHTYFDFYFAIVACLAILNRVCREEWLAMTAAEDDFAESDVPPGPGSLTANAAGA